MDDIQCDASTGPGGTTHAFGGTGQVGKPKLRTSHHDEIIMGEQLVLQPLNIVGVCSCLHVGHDTA